jgi:hypothetical protein
MVLRHDYQSLLSCNGDYIVVCIPPIAVCAVRTLRSVRVLLFLLVFRGTVLVVALAGVTAFLEVDWVFPLIEITILRRKSLKVMVNPILIGIL